MTASAYNFRAVRAAARQLQSAEWLMLGAFGVFAFVYPFAILLLSFDLMPFGMEWMSSLLLVMLGLCAWGWLWTNFGRVGLAIGAGVSLTGLGLEYVGVATGLPFGKYKYTGVLIPELPGGVPLAIGFAWLLIAIAGLFTAQWLLRWLHVPARMLRWSSALTGAVLAVGLDLLLEPVAYRVKGYWLWLDGGTGYYGVPWGNFAAWFTAALLISILVVIIIDITKQTAWGWMPVVLYGMNVAMFGLVNISHEMWVPGLVGATIMVVLFLVALAANPRVQHRP